MRDFTYIPFLFIEGHIFTPLFGLLMDGKVHADTSTEIQARAHVLQAAFGIIFHSRDAHGDVLIWVFLSTVRSDL